MKVGDLVKFTPREGCPDPDYLGLIIKDADRLGLVKVWWFGSERPMPWQPEELKVVSENKI